MSELRINIINALRSGVVTPTKTAELSVTTLTRHIRLLGKYFRRLQQLDGPRFIALPGCSDLVLYYWSKVVQSANNPKEWTEGAYWSPLVSDNSS